MRVTSLVFAGGLLPGLSLAAHFAPEKAFHHRDVASNTTISSSSTALESTSFGSSAVGTKTGSAGSTSGSATSSSNAASTTTASGSSATSTVDFSGATFHNAKLTTYNGHTAVLMSAPANGEAYVTVKTTPPKLGPGDGISVSMDIVGGSPSRKRATATDCTLEVLLDGESVYDSAIDTGAASVKSSAISVSGDPTLQIVEKCGADPVSLIVYNVALVATPLGSTTTSGAASETTTGTASTGTAGETNTGTAGQTNTGTAGQTNTGTAGQTNTGTAGQTNTGTAGETNTGTAGETNTGTAGESTTGTAGTTSTGTENSSATSGSSTATTGTGATTPSTGSPSATPTSAFPTVVGNFVFYGCVDSSDNFPSFYLGGSNDKMDIEQCTTICANATYAGVFDSDCYCGSTVDGTSTTKVDTDRCDVSCPGDATEKCGGRVLSTRRRDVSDAILLTVYKNINAAGATVTEVTTVTTAPTGTVVEICVNGYCGDSWTFEPYPGEECSGLVVFIIESCSCHGGYVYTPLLCSGDACVGLTVYKPTKCTDMSGATTVFQPESCDSCEGGVVFVQCETQPGASATNVAVSTATTLAVSAKASGSAGTGSAGTGSAETGSEASGESSSTSTETSTPPVTAGSGRLVAWFGWLTPAFLAIAAL